MNISLTLVNHEHGFDDFNVEGLPKVHRACVGHGIREGDIFNVYCADGVKLGAVWRGSVEDSLRKFAVVNQRYRDLLDVLPASGSVGKHDWCVGAATEDGCLVFVDDRPLGYQASPWLATCYALSVIARLQADGDYRLNDKPAGFLPPPLSSVFAPAFAMTITEAVMKHGLEFLRGRAVTDGHNTLYIHDKDLDAAIELWADEPEKARLQKRFYGGKERNDEMCQWIYGSYKVIA